MKKEYQIVSKIDKTITIIQEYKVKFAFPNDAYLSEIIVLQLLKKDLAENKESPERLLRGFKDVCTSIALYDEGTEFYDLIFEIKDFLELIYPQMTKLDLLRSDFGNGFPV